MNDEPTPTPTPSIGPAAAWLARIERVMAHAWMVRTFLKHCQEVEDFPQLMETVRTIFDASRALETRVGDAVEQQKMLRKKLSKLKATAADFRALVAAELAHTNFLQAVVSLDDCVEELAALAQTPLDPT
ncbi:MAG: amidohydrolase [Planctomycetia bacterium]